MLSTRFNSSVPHFVDAMNYPQSIAVLPPDPFDARTFVRLSPLAVRSDVAITRKSVPSLLVSNTSCDDAMAPEFAQLVWPRFLHLLLYDVDKLLEM